MTDSNQPNLPENAIEPSMANSLAAMDCACKDSPDTGAKPPPDPRTAEERGSAVSHVEKLNQERGGESQPVPKVLRTPEAATLEVLISLCNEAARAFRGIVRTPHDIEDVAQDTAFKYLKNFARGKEPPLEVLRPWVYCVVRRKCIAPLRAEATRKLKRKPMAEDFKGNAEDPVDQLTTAELRTLADRVVTSLDARGRECWRLCKLEGMTYAEAAKVMEIDEEAVKYQIGKALKTLREAMTNGGYGIG